ncbi:cobalt ABC transporter permease [Paraclostridium sordellii]|uniref:cobalt ABC transporter permease n=1 Tax=Paraclostridium sordellii TaxID=1505 RepID=UPI0005DAA9CB|nr:cobalt ABC transporter permease [Paeniclostridium sordellii]CEN21266.1 phage-like protein [[Clostridium] sordellii] [Paeniclostridium sordellii]CEP39570.1 phage-like protein [[Clostridium] sordellii] [Paeniclostridium sordellii]CEP42300.1 phage-like protein [[Clostridium] sordellii] [Paeniclostridium sordellii]
MEKFLDPILSSLGVAIAGVLVVVIKSVGEVAREFIKIKIEAAEQKIKFTKYNEVLEVGKNIWNIVEEKYRITDNLESLAESKAKTFDKLLLEKFPHLTEKELKEVRQAIAGEYNKGKSMLHEESLKQQASELIEENNKLKSENSSLSTKLTAISNYVPSENK